jgi:hypothetical protein
MNSWLAIHLLGAGMTAGLLAVAIHSLVRRQSQWYIALSRCLALSFVVQAVTGLGLGLSSGEGLSLGLCARLGAYTVIIMGAQVALVGASKSQVSKNLEGSSGQAQQ